MEITRIALVSRVNHFVMERFNVGVWWLLALIAFVVSRVTQMWLDGHYARSKFPVSFFEGQTAFDGPTIKGYYAQLQEMGTFDIYVFVQRIDYLFMLTVMVSLFLLGAAALRTIPSQWRKGWVLKLALLAMWITPMAAAMDAMENLVSFVMLANPAEFADWLAYPYSGFAVGKFALFALNYLWVSVALLVALLKGITVIFSRIIRTQPV